MTLANFTKELFKFAELAREWCDTLEDDTSGCMKCVLKECDSCPANFAAFVYANEDWLNEVQDQKCPDLEAQMRELTELSDSLAARVSMLEEENQKLKEHKVENTVLRNHLTQEVLTNLEMRIALDMKEFYREVENDICM